MMDFTNILAWIEANPYVVGGAVLLLSLLTFIVARAVLARGLTYLARRTKTEFDDILVENSSRRTKPLSKRVPCSSSYGCLPSRSTPFLTRSISFMKAARVSKV